MERLLNKREVCALLNIGTATLTRLVRSARKGESDFPLPIQEGRRKKLLFHPGDIARWAKYKVSPSPSIALLETPEKVKQRFKKACSELEGYGIRVPLKPLLNFEGNSH